MSDDDLIARLRTMSTNINGWGHGAIAADRIEALVRELATSNEIGRAFEEDAGQQRARAERLEAALREIAETFDGKSVAAIARAALKGADHD